MVYFLDFYALDSVVVQDAVVRCLQAKGLLQACLLAKDMCGCSHMDALSYCAPLYAGLGDYSI